MPITLAGVIQHRLFGRVEVMSREFNRGRLPSEPVLDRVQCGPHTFDVLEKLSSAREVYRVIERSGAMELRRLTILPFGRAGEQHLRSLKRVTENDPCHLPILELRRVGGRLFVVQPWIVGQSLEQYLDKARRGRAPVPGAVQAFRLARGLAHAMAKVHRVNDVVHGDLKPANVLLVRGRNRLIPIDYGSAWPGGETLRRVSGDGVSPVYAGPEQLRPHGAVDWRADQFALGVILYELLTLKIPYEGLGGRVGVTAGGEGISLTPPSSQSGEPSQLPRPLWNYLDSLVGRMLASDASHRFASDSELLAEFDRIDLALRVSEDKGRFKVGIWELIIELLRRPRSPSRSQ